LTKIHIKIPYNRVMNEKISSAKGKVYQTTRLKKIAKKTRQLLDNHELNSSGVLNELEHTQTLLDEALETLDENGLTNESHAPIRLLLHQQRLLRQHLGIGGFTSDIPF
jgi:hypothetical protein